MGVFLVCFCSLGNEKVFLSLPWIILEATGLAGRMYLRGANCVSAEELKLGPALLEAEPGLEWTVWEQNLPPPVFQGLWGSLSCLWILCTDILSFGDTGKRRGQGPDQTN